MGLSTISIHMATLQWQGSSPSKNVLLSLVIQFIRAPIIITCIIFKAGTLALVFSTLKYGGFVIAALWMAPVMLFFILHLDGNSWPRRYDKGLKGEETKDTARALQASLMNIITIVFFDEGDNKQKWFVRILHWGGFVLHSVTLGVCYLLTYYADPCHKTCSNQCDDGDNWTFHWSETNGWLRVNMDIAAGFLIAIGLLSCILFEIFNKLFPCCMDTKEN